MVDPLKSMRNNSDPHGMTTFEDAGEVLPHRRRGLRLTSRVFWDMAIYMVCLGLVVGLIFPPFAGMLGVPDTITERPIFRSACLMAGFLVGAMKLRPLPRGGRRPHVGAGRTP